ncbi:MAG: replication protein [Clostridiales bacterium]|nr:replication protein [Clostridiales bacterium]
MNKNIHNLIKIEYEKKQISAFDKLQSRKEELYIKVPRLQEIENEIQFSGIKYNKMILLGITPVEENINQLSYRIDELKAEKQRLLKDFGFELDYLETVFECPNCKDTGYIELNNIMEKCTCYKQNFINHLYSLSNLKLNEQENFATFDPSYYPDLVDEAKYGFKISPKENILKIKERSENFVKNFRSPNEKNLFFSGFTGVGKTYMSCCIARELLDRGRTVLYQSSPSLFNTITEHKQNAFKNDGFIDDSYSYIFDAELLIIDDLGTEPPSAARYAELLSILDTRHSNNLTRPCKTIIASNIGVKQLHEYYDERVASRVIGSFDMFRFVGEDIRMTKKMLGR